MTPMMTPGSNNHLQRGHPSPSPALLRHSTPAGPIPHTATAASGVVRQHFGFAGVGAEAEETQPSFHSTSSASALASPSPQPVVGSSGDVLDGTQPLTIPTQPSQHQEVEMAPTTAQAAGEQPYNTAVDLAATSAAACSFDPQDAGTSPPPIMEPDSDGKQPVAEGAEGWVKYTNADGTTGYYYPDGTGGYYDQEGNYYPAEAGGDGR